MSSIRRFLILTLISALVLVVFSAALHGYRATLAISNTLLDSELVQLTQAVALIQGETIEEETALFFQIWHNGKLMSTSIDNFTRPLTTFSSGYSEVNAMGKRWRVYAYSQDKGQTWYMVAQPLRNRYALTDALTVAAITPFIVSVPILALILFFGISWGLAPLKQLSRSLAQRQGNDFAPIELNREPSELKPVVNTLNSMFKRLSAAFEREQQFASNAAHELRTPLSVMKINIHNITEELGDKGDLLSSLQNDTDRMIHAVNQFLMLTRTSPDTFVTQREPVNLYFVAQDVISDLYSQIELKQQDISLEGEEVWLSSSPFMLYTLLQNLIANASHYSHPGDQIIVDIQRNGASVLLKVSDSGPGIPEEERLRVLERFVRAANSNTTTGSGLGLAIVSQIVELHFATMTLKQAKLGGLEVEVVFGHDSII